MIFNEYSAANIGILRWLYFKKIEITPGRKNLEIDQEKKTKDHVFQKNDPDPFRIRFGGITQVAEYDQKAPYDRVAVMRKERKDEREQQVPGIDSGAGKQEYRKQEQSADQNAFVIQVL